MVKSVQHRIGFHLYNKAHLNFSQIVLVDIIDDYYTIGV
jgi:hypothetical protein